MIPTREETQRKLDRCAAAGQAHKPGQPYTIADRLEARAAERPHAPYLHYQGATLTYGEVNARANRVAHAVRSLGLRRGEVCALMMENRPDYFSVWFGLVKLGVTVAQINTQIRGASLRHALQAAGAKVCIAGEECLANFDTTDAREALPIWSWRDEAIAAADVARDACALDLSMLAARSADDNLPPDWRAGIVASDRALLVYTSGTTGLPKASVTSHMRWLMSGDVMRVAADISGDDVFYCFLPLFHGAAGMSLASTALAAGASIVLRRRFSSSEFWNDVRRYRVTVCQYIGEICRYLLNVPARPDDRDHTLRKMIGAGLGADIWETFRARFGIERIIEGWGSTEANTALSNLDNRPGSCGRVPFWEKTNLRIVRYDPETDKHPRDAAGWLIPCEPGEAGEVIGMVIDHPEIGGGRFEGYTDADATRHKVMRDVFRTGDAWWRSGDLLRYDADGYFYFVDRIGDTFRWKSENVSTLEVTHALSDFAGLEIVNIYGVSVPGQEGRAGMAALSMKPGVEFDAQAFYGLAQSRLPAYAMPLFVRLSGGADLTASFKLRKVDLQREGYDPARFDDPLFIRHDEARTYAPYSAELLARLNLPPSA